MRCKNHIHPILMLKIYPRQHTIRINDNTMVDAGLKTCIYHLFENRNIMLRKCPVTGQTI